LGRGSHRKAISKASCLVLVRERRFLRRRASFSLTRTRFEPLEDGMKKDKKDFK